MHLYIIKETAKLLSFWILKLQNFMVYGPEIFRCQHFKNIGTGLKSVNEYPTVSSQVERFCSRVIKQTKIVFSVGSTLHLFHVKFCIQDGMNFSRLDNGEGR